MEGKSSITQDEAGPIPKRAKHDTSWLSGDLQRLVDHVRLLERLREGRRMLIAVWESEMLECPGEEDIELHTRRKNSKRNGERHSRVLDDEKTRLLDDNTLFEVAERLGGDWVKLAIKLGFTTIQVRNIEKNYPNDITRQALQMLVTWKQAQVSSAERQLATLGRALKNIRREDIASFLYEPCIDDFVLRRTAVKLDDDWKPLAVDELGFTKSKVETIEQEYEEDIPRQGYEMLKTWKQDQPTSVELQVDTLCTALKNIGRVDIVVFLHERIRLPREMNKTLIA